MGKCKEKTPGRKFSPCVFRSLVPASSLLYFFYCFVTVLYLIFVSNVAMEIEKCRDLSEGNFSLFVGYIASHI